MGGPRGSRAELYMCPACGYRYMVWRRRSQLRRRGHRKRMWCPVCARTRDYVKVWG